MNYAEETHYRGVAIPETLVPNWDQPEAHWWRMGVDAGLPVELGLSDHLAAVADGPLPANAKKVLDTAEANGWAVNGKGHTMVVRLDKPDDEMAVPFYVSWLLVVDPVTRRRSWRFSSAGAAILQSMNHRDVMAYLQDPTIIWPDAIEGEVSGN